MRLEDRFWSKVDQSGGERACWPWTAGTVRHGYGRISVPPRGHSVRAHRLAYELTFGPVKDGWAVLHACDNPPCCNPFHLFLGSQADNVRDMHFKGRAKILSGSANGRFRGDGGRSARRRRRYAVLRASGLSPAEVRNRV
jgi:hypothetical protein